MTSSSRLRKYSNSGGTPHYSGSDLEFGRVHRLQQTHQFAYEELEEPTAASATRESSAASDDFGTMHDNYRTGGQWWWSGCTTTAAGTCSSS